MNLLHDLPPTEELGVDPNLVGKISYAQEGEDLVLARLLGMPREQPGFYVDIGAHHPCRFSNTHYFHLHGWRGINVEPMPGSMEVFKEYRPDDINLELAVFDQATRLIYYSFSEPALNTFSPEIAALYQTFGYRLTGQIEIPTVTLVHVLEHYLPKDVATIDFLSVDVEGADLEVLQSNDWDRFRPTYVLAEELNVRTLAQAQEASIARFLQSKNYLPIAKTVNTVIFGAKEREK